MPRYTLLTQIESSHEFHSDEVATAFETYLRRVPDSDSVNAFANALDSGATMTQVRADLIGSDEYFSRFGSGTNAGFLNAMYSDVLGRPVDAFGQSLLPLLEGSTDAADRCLRLLVFSRSDFGSGPGALLDVSAPEC